MEEKFDRQYDPREVEKRFRKEWKSTAPSEYDGCDRDRRFNVCISPVSVLHPVDVQSTCMMVIADILRRYRRMREEYSRHVFMLPFFGIGNDHALEEDRADRDTDDPPRMTARESLFSAKLEGITDIFERLGCQASPFPRPENEKAAVDTAARRFVSLYERDMICYEKRVTPWCPHCGTAVSEEEVTWQVKTAPVWFIKYQISGRTDPILIPILRPEELYAVTAIAVPGEDERFTDLIGSTVPSPVEDREIPVIGSRDGSDMNVTGIMHVIPGHDDRSATIAKSTGLAAILVTDEAGLMSVGPATGCDGMGRFECRELVVHRLRTEKRIGRVEKWNVHIGHCRYCNTIIDQRLSGEWFLKTGELGRTALSLLEDDVPRFAYEAWRRRYIESIGKSGDWCMSRRMRQGDPVPAYHCMQCGEFIVSTTLRSTCISCGGAMAPSDRKLDPWFSLAQRIACPIPTAPDYTVSGDPDHMDLLVCSYEDTVLWLKRVVQTGIALTDGIPCSEVFITPHMEFPEHAGGQDGDDDGGIDVDRLTRYGADVMRFGLAHSISDSHHICMDEDSFRNLRGFVDEFWKAYRFLRSQSALRSHGSWGPVLELQTGDRLDLSDRWILSRMNGTMEEMERHMGRNLLSEAAACNLAFIWRDFCNWYLGLIRSRISGGDEPAITVTSAVFSVCVRLLSPFMPFLASELWHGMHDGYTAVRELTWPEPVLGFRDRAAEHDMEELQDIIMTIRKLRGELKIPDSKTITILIHTPTEKLKDSLTRNAGCIRTLGNVQSMALIDEVTTEGAVATAFLGETSLIMPLDGVVDIDRERERLGRELEKTEKQIIKCRQKLQNDAFLEKAPETVVQSEKNRLERLEDTRNRYLGFLETLS